MRKYEDIINYIQAYYKQNGHSPSMKEIADGCYRSTSTVSKAIEVLAARGHLNYKPGIARSITIPKPQEDDTPNGNRNHRIA